jgi:hypothetical protein
MMADTKSDGQNRISGASECPGGRVPMPPAVAGFGSHVVGDDGTGSGRMESCQRVFRALRRFFTKLLSPIIRSNASGDARLMRTHSF